MTMLPERRADNDNHRASRQEDVIDRPGDRDLSRGRWQFPEVEPVARRYVTSAPL
jgi:hypothetical protein